MTTIQITCTIIVVIATIINLFFAYRNFVEKTAVVEIKVENLPPYSNPEEKTTVLLKNVGTTKTSANFEALITCSWMPNMSYKLNLPNQAFFLAPNEEVTWKIRLDNDVIKNSTVSIKVTDKRGYYWDRHDQVS
jgi:hypothetical protein